MRNLGRSELVSVDRRQADWRERVKRRKGQAEHQSNLRGIEAKECGWTDRWLR